MSLLVFSIIVSIVNALLPAITKKLSKYFTEKAEVSENRQQIERIKTEMNALSITDEFPKYARLQRELVRHVKSVKLEVEAYKERKTRLTYTIQYVVQGVMTLLSLSMFWLFRYHPVIEFPSEWIYPLEYVVSWPTHTPGFISFPVWFLITNSVAKMIVGT